MPVSVGYVTRETATNLRRNLLITIGAVLTVAVSLSLVGAARLAAQGVARANVQFRGGVELSIFLKADVSENQTKAIQSELDRMRGTYIDGVKYVDKREAFLEFKEMFAKSPEMRESLTEEEMPPSFRVTPKQAEEVDVIGERFETRAGVLDVVYADSLKELLKRTDQKKFIAYVVATVLLLSASLLIFNTIQMAIFARRREVGVMKLVGATNWFIRVPFMLEGMIQGLAGAGVAFAVVYTFRDALIGLILDPSLDPLNRLLATPGEAMLTGVLLLLVGAFVGGVGSAIAVARYLDV